MASPTSWERWTEITTFPLIWIVVYYIAGQSGNLPVITDLAQYNLMVGIGFMAVGFVYATHWE